MHRRALLVAITLPLLLAHGLACSAMDDRPPDGADPIESPVTSPAPDVGDVGTGVFGRIPGIVEQVEPWVVAIATGSGEGSGVIVGSDGIIVTNAHVVGDAEQVEVQFADGERAPARVLARESRIDLALVDADRGELPTARFATALPRTGELAVAVGNPLGFENTVTAGIVSGLERAIPGGGPALVGLIQTDAPISPGNSGGALVNQQAELMGINVAYIPPQGGAVALGFAIPAVFVRSAVEEMRTTGRITFPYLGLTPRTLTPQLAGSFGGGTDRGVLVLATLPGGPADRAGLRRSDVIVSADDEDLQSVEDLFAVLRRFEPGDRITIAVARPGGAERVVVELGALPT